MREIKFRLWDMENEQMINLDKVGDPEHYAFLTDKDGSLYFYNYQNGSGGDEYIIMQYTGLKDINGKVIYEGDIVEINQDGEVSTHTVVYQGHKDYPAFDLEPYIDCDCNALSYAMAESNIEVIGNIYENPELLEVE